MPVKHLAGAANAKMPKKSQIGCMAISKTYATASALLLTSALAAPARAEPPARPEAPAATHASAGLEQKFSVMAGLSQWLLFRGGNLALEYKIGRFAFELSHGQGLDLNQVGGFALSSAERRDETQVRVPWTTGFGVGYRITENLHLLLEFKAHHYEVRANEGAHAVSYTTFSVGPGAFYSIYLSKHLFLEPNLRFWPNVGSTLHDNRVMLERCDGTSYEHQAHDFGFFGNVNLGYSF
ncbi:MAG TPA: hypothetical protein VGJ91_05870 [Polyangiaceae bacterium]